MDETFTQAARDIQSGFTTAINDIIFDFDDLGDAWDSLMGAMKRAFSNMVAQLVSSWFMSGLSGLFKGEGFEGFSLGKLFGFSNEKSYAEEQWGKDGEFGSSQNPFGLGADATAGSGFKWNELWGGGEFGAGNAMGIVGGGIGVFNAYQSGDPLGGAMAGAAMGTSILPGWGTAIGAVVGGLAGLLGGGNDDSAEREADAARAKELAELIYAKEGTKDDYLEAIKLAIRSDNRVSGEAMEGLYQEAKKQGILDWYTPSPGQLGPPYRRNYTDDQWKRYQIYGGAEQGEMGAFAFAELFGGAGQGGWGGGKDRWAQIKDVMEGLSDETIEKLGSSMGTFKDLAMEWGVSIQDLLGPLIDADLAGDSWKEALEELSAATLIQNAADAERAKGLSELEVINNKVMRTIKLMAGWNDMDAEGKSEMIDMIREDAGRREELLKASERLKEIEDQLMGSHKLSKEEVEALAEEYASLTEMLGLNDTASANAASAAEEFARVMNDEVIPAIRDALELAGGDPNSSHHGGLIYHSGGMVGAMLNAGMITPHGGAPRMHVGGLRPDERMTILQAGEFVVQRKSVNHETMNLLREINRTGKPPTRLWPDFTENAMDRIGQALSRYHTGGMVNGASTPQPAGGDSGKPVTVNFSPQITVNAESGADQAKIEAAVERALEKGRVALKRQLEQTGYQVVDAQ